MVAYHSHGLLISILKQMFLFLSLHCPQHFVSKDVSHFYEVTV